MRAIAKCKSCGTELETNCRTCIEAGVNYHKCKEGFKVVKVEWKIVPEGGGKLGNELK